MSAIEDGDWQEIDEPEIYGEDRKQVDEVDPAEARPLSGHLGHPKRPADFFHRTVAGQYLAQYVDNRARDVERDPGRFRKDAESRDLFENGLASKHAKIGRAHV